MDPSLEHDVLTGDTFGNATFYGVRRVPDCNLEFCVAYSGHAPRFIDIEDLYRCTKLQRYLVHSLPITYIPDPDKVAEDSANSDEEFLVHNIVACCLREARGVTHVAFKVHWDGYPDEDDTVEPLASLWHLDVLQAYLLQHLPACATLPRTL